VQVVALIPGVPVAQGRPRAFRTKAGAIRTFDPAKSRNWKAMAHEHMRAAMDQAGMAAPFAGAVLCRVFAVFTCPKSDWRKRARIRRCHAKRPDAENVAKAVLDAATGVIWLDDAQVAELSVSKVIGAQGEAPYVQVTVQALEEVRP
jgi:Holliday junction resolvase RusA-like endonuclease